MKTFLDLDHSKLHYMYMSRNILLLLINVLLSYLQQRIQEDIVAHQETMDSVLKQAKQISENSSDTRTQQYAAQLKARFDTLASNVQVSYI